MNAQSYELPRNMNFSHPSKTLTGSKNYFRVSPVAGQTFSPGQEIKFNITSREAFLDPARCYLKYKITFNGTYHANHRLKKVGLASVIRQVDSWLGGAQVDTFQNYADYLSVLYQNQPIAYQDALKTLECYNDTANNVVDDETGFAAGRVVIHALRSSILEQKYDMIPLAFIRSGLSISITLDTLARSIAHNTNSGITSFILSDVEFICCLITPPQQYLHDFQNRMNAGRVATIPLEIVRCFTNTPTNASEATEQFSLGFVKSLKSHYQLIQDNNPVATSSTTASTDFSAAFGVNGHTDYYYESSGERWPKNKAIGCSLTNPENFMQLLCATDNSYPMIDSQTSANYLFYEFSSDKSFGSGIPISDGTLSLVKRGTPTSTSVNQLNYFFMDAMLLISNDSVSLDFRSLEPSAAA